MRAAVFSSWSESSGLRCRSSYSARIRGYRSSTCCCDGARQGSAANRLVATNRETNREEIRSALDFMEVPGWALEHGSEENWKGGGRGIGGKPAGNGTEVPGHPRH